MNIAEITNLDPPDYEGVGYGVEIEVELSREVLHVDDYPRVPSIPRSQTDDSMVTPTTTTTTNGEEYYTVNIDDWRRDVRGRPELMAEDVAPLRARPSLYTQCEGWRTHTDGSLRNGIEYVFDEPCIYKEGVSRLDKLYEVIQANKLVTSHRTGMHVHVDVRTFTRNQLGALFAGYIACEPWLMALAGESRWNNVFCVPVHANPEQARYVAGVVATRSPAPFMRRISSDFNKYSSINFLPILSQGSVEFRMAPTFDARENAMKWFYLVHRIVERTRGLTARSIADMFLEDSHVAVHRLFPEVSDSADPVEWAVPLEYAAMIHMQDVRAEGARPNW